jgi:hypothetical protein
MHRLEEHLLERPELQRIARVINNVQSLSPEGVYSMMFLTYFLMLMICEKERYLMILNGMGG